MPGGVTNTTTAASRSNFDPSHVKEEFNQYWYSQNTIDALIHEVTHHATACAFLSTPSLFFALDTRRGDESSEVDARLQKLRQQSRLFEYDTHWASDPCYVMYDFHQPEEVPIQYMAAFDYVVADPPFITKDVWERYVATTKFLLKEGGKLLFTTVLENHTMLESFVNCPLFIAAFYPLVEHLTYQYVCFLSYEPTVLAKPNPEVQEVNSKMTAAIRMANDLRSSEKEFALQMATRKREGETRLPTAAYERDMQLARDPIAKQKAEEEQQKGVDWDSVPIEKMEWGHIPEGLTMYPDGNEEKRGTDAGENVSFGAEYDACLKLRTDLDMFKSFIDAMQRHMDTQMKLRRQRLKLIKELDALKEQKVESSEQSTKDNNNTSDSAVALMEAQIAEVTAAVNANEAERNTQLDIMAQLALQIEEEEHTLAALQEAEGTSSLFASPLITKKSVPYVTVMADCIAAYRTVEAKKAPLQELAANATGRYKFPIFSRMKELLQRIKELKQK